MLAPTDRQIVERFKSLMAERGLPVLETIVFGSRARGDCDEESDLDILVLVSQRTREIVDAVRDCAWEIGFDSNRYIQTVIRSKDEVENTPLRSSLLMLAVQAEGISV